MSAEADQPLTVSEVELATDTICRCGTKVRRGAEVLEVRGGSPDAIEIFRGVAFTYLVCLRAFLLEELESLANSTTLEADDLSKRLLDLYWKVDAAFRGSIRSYFTSLKGAVS